MPTVWQQEEMVEIGMVGVEKQTTAELSRGPLFFLCGDGETGTGGMMGRQCPQHVVGASLE